MQQDRSGLRPHTRSRCKHLRLAGRATRFSVQKPYEKPPRLCWSWWTIVMTRQSHYDCNDYDSNDLYSSTLSYPGNVRHEDESLFTCFNGTSCNFYYIFLLVTIMLLFGLLTLALYFLCHKLHHVLPFLVYIVYRLGHNLSTVVGYTV